MQSPEFEQTILANTTFLQRAALKLTRCAHEAADLVQDTLLRALRYRDKYTEGTRLEAWLYTILRNSYISAYRKKKCRRDAKQRILQREQTLAPTSGNEGWNRMLLKTINQKIEELPSLYRQPMKLALEGYQYQEIAKATGRPLSTIKSQIHYGRSLLRASLRPLVQ